MDMRRMKDEDKLFVCKCYFYGGFALLPFLWLMNAVWFFNEAYIVQRVYSQKAQIKRYVTLSLIAFGIELALLFIWIIYFQKNRVTASWGDQLSFIFPAGYA